MNYKTDNLNTEEIIHQVQKRLDYSVDYKNRCKIIEDIDKDFGEDINSLYCAYSITNSKTFSNNGIMDKINQLFETMSNYLLMADGKCETEEQKKSASEYPFKSQENLKDGKAEKFLCLEDFINILKTNEYENVFNSKTKIKDITVQYVVDNIRDCEYILDYIKFEKEVTKIIKSLENQYEDRVKNKEEPKNIEGLKWTNNDTGNTYYYTAQQYFTLRRGVGYTGNNCKELNQDVIAVFKEYYRPFSSRRSPQEMEFGRIIDLDFFDEEHVRGLILNSCMVGWSSKFDFFVRRLDRIIDNVFLSPTEFKVYTLLRNGKYGEFSFCEMEKQKYSQTEIAKILGIRQQNVAKALNRITKKVMQEYEIEFEDYYYTFLVKGKYKTCSECGNVKLLNPRNFLYRNDTKNYENRCRVCRGR